MLAVNDVVLVLEDEPTLTLEKLERAVVHLAAAVAILRPGAKDDHPVARTPSASDERHAAQITPAHAGWWRVELGPEMATVPDRIGMRYLAQLTAAPDQAVPALALVTWGSAPSEPHRADAVLDRRAVADIRNRIRALREQADRSSADEEELAHLTHELVRATGLGGRMRSFADAPERARTAVRKAIKRAIDAISFANPAVGRHLAARVETGAVCCYRRVGPPPCPVPRHGTAASRLPVSSRAEPARATS